MPLLSDQGNPRTVCTLLTVAKNAGFEQVYRCIFTEALHLQVFESAKEYTPQGAGVLINLNGQNALEAIDPQLYER